MTRAVPYASHIAQSLTDAASWVLGQPDLPPNKRLQPTAAGAILSRRD
jgi:hypothetical protein